MRARGPPRKKSRTLSAEIQSEIQKSNEIQKSTLKSRNPLWNPEIHFEIRKSNLMTLRVYPYTLNN